MKNEDYTVPVDNTNIFIPFREAYKDAGYNNYREFADDCSVPQSSVSKFFAGLLKAPNFFSLMSMALTINRRMGFTRLSLDEICGIEPKKDDRLADYAAMGDKLERLKEANAEKDRRIRELETALAHEKEKFDMQEKAYLTLKKSDDDRRPIMRKLMTIIILLVILLIYVIIDATSPLWGLFQH